MTGRSAAGTALAVVATAVSASHSRVAAQQSSPAGPAATAVYYVDFDAGADTHGGRAPNTGR